MTARAHYRTFPYDGQDEHVLCLGEGSARRILIVPPLFDEMNRMRRTLVQAMRVLAGHGVTAMLIDLPGTNESLAPLEAQSLAIWRTAIGSAAESLAASHVASLRGGALIDDGAAGLPHWRLAPAKGGVLLKTLLRTRITGDREAGRAVSEAELRAAASAGPIELAGNRLGPAMVADLADAVPAKLANCAERRLGEDVAGAPLWLRAEPGDDAAMAEAIAEDLDRWSAACDG